MGSLVMAIGEVLEFPTSSRLSRAKTSSLCPVENTTQLHSLLLEKFTRGVMAEMANLVMVTGAPRATGSANHVL
jgi:hypothetical protein